ncbi:NAD-dependent epimerase/dehydratase family protein [Halomonas salina]|uniref:NAD-dependent epimerase/dehydratase family protein n=1 Tax=Halomonas salina TaxID=42565 RepID=UPI0009DE91CB|nr:NAD-dependent epimerase/dehydratase family protein [Halomonas salina]
MRVLVTGGSGFVATHIIDGLSSLNNIEVLAASRKKVSGVVSRKNVKFFEAPDILDSNGWSRLLDGVDVIVHTAAKAHGGGVIKIGMKVKYTE